jgi:hypothetical protein
VFVLQAGVLVTLVGCHLLDGLVYCGSVEARKEIVRSSKEGFVRGIVLTPWGSRRATLVERVIELPHLRVGSWCARMRTMCGSRTGGWSLLGVMSD